MACNVVINHNREDGRLKKSSLHTEGYSGMGETEKELCNHSSYFALNPLQVFNNPCFLYFACFYICNIE